MRWKKFQWTKFLFRHSSNSRQLSRHKYYNELACVFTAHYASKNADWNQQQLTDGGILANWNSANHPYCFLSNQKKSPDSGFFTCDPTKKCIMPSSRERHKGIIGRGHDLRLRCRKNPNFKKDKLTYLSTNFNFLIFTRSKKAEASSYERMLISKSRYLSLFNVFFSWRNILSFSEKSRPRASGTCADQGPHVYCIAKVLLLWF